MGGPLICDNGSGFMKAGWASENFPEINIPAIVGRPMLRSGEKIADVELKELMIADEAAPVRSMLELKYPIEEGIVKDWENMEILWDYAFKNKLHMNQDKISNTKLLLTEAALNPQAHREKMAEVMFEKFGFSHVRVDTQALLSLYAEGMNSGVVLDSGDGVTHSIPVYEGFVLKHQVRRLNLAGRHVTNYLIKLLLLRGYAFNSTADFETVREMKEKLCFASYNLEEDRRLARETTVLNKEYVLPDGKTVVTVGRERFEATECLFNPFLVDIEGSGMSDLIFETINDCAIDIRAELYQRVLLSGGTSMFPGLPSRIEKDIRERYLHEILGGRKEKLKGFKLSIHDSPRRKYGVFMGGAIVARIYADNEQAWLSKKEYEEYGVKGIHRFEQSA